MRLAVPRRQQNGEVPADHVLRRVTEDFFGAAIEVDDVLRVIDSDDRVGGDRQNAGELRLRCAERLLSEALFPEARPKIEMLNDEQREGRAGN
jgi:hypothetical protein